MSSRIVSHLVERLAGGVGEVPVDVALAGDEGALVAAAHRDHDVGLCGELAGEQLRGAVGEVDAELAHHLDDFGVNVVGGGGAGRERLVAAAGGALEQRLAHLGAPGVLAGRRTGRWPRLGSIALTTIS